MKYEGMCATTLHCSATVAFIRGDLVTVRKEQKKFKGKSYWLEDVFIDQGWCWAIEEIEKDDGHNELVSLCLGSEAEIVPILKGDKPIPEDMHPRRRAILTEILAEKDREHERVSKSTVRATRLQRGRLIRSPRHIQGGARHP